MTYLDYLTDYNKNTLLTRKEVANILMVKESMIDLWQTKNPSPLPAVMGEESPKFRFGDLLDFIERQNVNTADVENNN